MISWLATLTLSSAAFMASACDLGTSSVVEFTISIGASVLSTCVTGDAAA
jgi:hypothetical protein